MVVDSEQMGNLLIWDLWVQGTDWILDMHVMNMYIASYLNKTLDKILEVAWKYNKCKYLDSFLQHQHHFSPLFISVDGMLGNSEVPGQPPRHKVAAILPLDMRVCPE